jgi:hypothetical protein
MVVKKEELMKGRIVEYNSRSGMGAIYAEDGSITVAEFIGSYGIEKSDVVHGGIRQKDCFELYNETLGKFMNVSIAGTGCSPKTASRLLNNQLVPNI